MIKGAPINVVDYGAVGDGTTDCTSAINAAFAAASLSSNVGGKIVFPPGTYVITNQITLPSLVNVTIEGMGAKSVTAGSAPTYESSVNIIYQGPAGTNNAMFRAQASATVSFDRSSFKNIALNAAGLAKYCFAILGTSGATYHNDWHFDNVIFSYATDIGVIIGNESGSVDVDAYQVNFWECLWDKSPIGVYVNADNAYGPLIERGYFADTRGGNSGRVINHIRTALPGDCRVHDTYFSALAPLATIIDPITDAPVNDANIYCVIFGGSGTISDCHTEDCRFLKVLTTGQPFAQVTVSTISTNDNRNADAQGRNLNWNLGTAAYSVHNSGKLAIHNSQFGYSDTTVVGYRRLYNDGRLTIDEGAALNVFLGLYGQIIHGANSFIDSINGTNTSTIPLTSNWNLSKWQNSNTLMDSIIKFNGASGVSTLTADTTAATLKYGPYSAKSVTSVASTTYCSGLQITSKTTAHFVTLIVVGYADTFNGLNCYKSNPGMTPIGTSDGNIYVVYDSTTKEFVATLQYAVDLTAYDEIGCSIGMPVNTTGTYYYQILGFVPGQWDIADVTGLLPFIGNNKTPLIGATQQHLGASNPSIGTWSLGDIVWNSSPSSGGYAGWICVSAGTPGTWKTFGLIS